MVYKYDQNYFLTDMLKTGYFTPRQEIIGWINAVLKTQVTRIEQLGSGSIYCHLLDAAYPGKVPLSRVKWHSCHEVDFIYNFKILQTCFEHLSIAKYIEVQKLVKAKYQDNLEFIQWMKWEFSQRISLVKNYDAQFRRNYAQINLNFEVVGLPQHYRRRNSFKENIDSNILGKVRLSIKSPRDIVSSTALTQRDSKVADLAGQRKLREFIKTESDVESGRQREGRSRLQLQQFLICEGVKGRIMQAQDEQCF